MPERTKALELTWLGEPTKGDADAVLDGLAPAGGTYELAAAARRVRTVTYVDTADGRLRKAGQVLSHERPPGSGSGTLTVRPLATSGEEHTQRLTAPPTWPALAEALPEGEVRDAAAKAMWIRAVAPVAGGRVVTREVVVRDAQGETVAHAEWAELTGSHPARAEPLVRVTLVPEPGRKKDVKRIAGALRDTASFEPASGSWMVQLLREARADEGPARPAIDADLPARKAVATALCTFADAIAANVEGTLGDVDTEFLHDLRVGVRRTRSLLKLGRAVLPEALVTRYEPRFKWLGDLTTPTRDLDVYLLQVDELAASLVAGEPADLDAFAAHLRHERAQARRALSRGLKSQRFTRLLDDWYAELTALLEADYEGPTAAEFAANGLSRMVKRVTKRAKAVTADAPSEAIHDLRKRCKELRYLLEVAKPLCDATAHKAVLKDLKRLQDILGAFQDGEVQSAALRVFAERMLAAGKAPAPTLLAMGELSAKFVGQQRQARADLADMLPTFLGADLSRRMTNLLPG